MLLLPNMEHPMRGGQLVCLRCSVVFLFEGRGRLYSPILKEVIGMLPRVAPVPVIQYSANLRSVSPGALSTKGTRISGGYWKALKRSGGES